MSKQAKTGLDRKILLEYIPAVSSNYSEAKWVDTFIQAYTVTDAFCWGLSLQKEVVKCLVGWVARNNYTGLNGTDAIVD